MKLFLAAASGFLSVLLLTDNPAFPQGAATAAYRQVVAAGLTKEMDVLRLTAGPRQNHERLVFPDGARERHRDDISYSISSVSSARRC
jgi:hypothetical protein